jgi:AcrR family transcriptional regulator
LKSESPVPPQKAQRGRRRSGEVSGREVLLESALQAFSKFGYEGVSLRSIAADAGVDMALVARIFGSKADLWDYIVDSFAVRQVDHLAQIRNLDDEAEKNPEKAMQRFIQLFADISFHMPEFPAFLLLEASNPGPRLKKLNEELIEPFKAASRPLISKAREAGIIIAHNDELFFGMLISAISLPMVAPAVFCGKPTLSARLKNSIAKQAMAMFIVRTENLPSS